MQANHEILFQPMKIGKTEIKNRFVLCPMEGTNIIEFMTRYVYYGHSENCACCFYRSTT